jgi:hypothetical protein
MNLALLEMKKHNKGWFRACFSRAARTVFQTFVSMVVIGRFVGSTPSIFTIVLVPLLSGILSVTTSSIFGMKETTKQGAIYFEQSEALMKIDTPLSDIRDKDGDYICLQVVDLDKEKK